MILTLISIVLIIIGIIGVIIHDNTNHETLGFTMGLFGLAVGSLGAIICSVMILTNNTKIKRQSVKVELDNKIAEIQATKQLITTIQDDYARSVAITEYNNKVKEYKTQIESIKVYSESLWLNWFWCSEYKNYDSNAVEYILEIK